MQGTQAFTLTHLLVIIGVTILLIAGVLLLLPSGYRMGLSGITARAQLGTCAANLNALVKSMEDYSLDHRDCFPHRPGARQSVGLQDFVEEWGIKGEMFVCPATTDSPLREANTNISYSYQAPFAGDEAGITRDTKVDVVFLADKGNGIHDKTYDWAGLTSGDDAENTSGARAGMSRNHSDGRVQNVASRAGVITVRRSDVGCDLDNIWTLGDVNGGSRRGALSTGPVLHRDDSLLLDTDQ